MLYMLKTDFFFAFLVFWQNEIMELKVAIDKSGV